MNPAEEFITNAERAAWTSANVIPIAPDEVVTVTHRRTAAAVGSVRGAAPVERVIPIRDGEHNEPLRIETFLPDAIGVGYAERFYANDDRMPYWRILSISLSGLHVRDDGSTIPMGRTFHGIDDEELPEYAREFAENNRP